MRILGRIVGVQSTEQSAGIKARAFDPGIINLKYKAPKSEFVWHLLTPIRFYSKIKEENRKEKYNKGR